MAETRDLVVASVGAGLIVAAAQGLIAGIAFWLLGFNGPVMWGVATAFCSLVPVVGSALVWVPATLWLFLSGEIGRAVILIVVGVLGVGMVDNVLRPLILSGRTSASGLVVFLGLLGGASAFGFIGIVLGPIILVTAGSLLTAFTRADAPIIDSGADSGCLVLRRRGAPNRDRGGCRHAARPRRSGASAPHWRSSRRRHRHVRGTGRRRRLQPPDRRRVRPHRARTRSARCVSRGARARQLPAHGRDALRHRRAVPDVRRRDGPRPHRPSSSTARPSPEAGALVSRHAARTKRPASIIGFA